MKAVVIVAFALAACAAPAPPPPPNAHDVAFDFPAEPDAVPLNVLFVVDDSPAMAPYAANVVANAQRFATALLGAGVPAPNLHVGAITADLADHGALRRPIDAAGPFLTDVVNPDSSRTVNFGLPLDEALGVMLDVGSAGAAVGAPLEAARLALIANPDFLATSPFLVLVVITAQDDASPDPVADYAGFLADADAGALWVVTITAATAPRLDALGATAMYATSVPIAQADLSAAFSLLAPPTSPAATTNRCIDVPASESPADCTLSITLAGGDVAISPCPSADATCWAFEPCFEDGVAPIVYGLALTAQPRVFGSCAAPM